MVSLARLRTPLLVMLLALAGTLSTASAQMVGEHDLRMPDHLTGFWKKWWDAKENGDTDEMNEIVRGNREGAEEALDLILDDLSQQEVEVLHHEARTLAWTLDDVTRNERYISRVRLVLEMPMKDRVRRYRARRNLWDAIDLENDAKERRAVESWIAAERAYNAVQEEFESLGDYEQAMLCLSRCEQIEKSRDRPWERSQYLKQVVAMGEKLPFRESLVSEAQQALDALKSMGVDPDAPKPESLKDEEEEAGVSGGFGLEAFAEGSEWQEFPLEREAPKKGISGVALPTVYPDDQFQLWPMTWINGEGPDKFDIWRTYHLAPWGKQWTLTRPGMFEFGLDSDSDGEVDVEFSTSNTPSRIEVPGPDGQTLPLMVCTLADRELMFGVETNYAPNAEGTRLRFWIASWMEGKVLGDVWKLYDLNMDGTYGAPLENFDDIRTWYDQDGNVSFWEPDGVLVGRSKKAAPLSAIMELDDGFFRVRPAPDGTSVSVREMDVATGHVKVDYDIGKAPDFLLARAVDEEFQGVIFDILPSRRGGTVELPAGEYQICLGTVSTGKKTSKDLVRIYTGKSEPFKVLAGVTTSLEFGAPYTLTFKTSREGDESVLNPLSIRVFGRGGEEYAMFFDDPLQPDVSVRDQKGTSVVKGDTLLRTGIEQWQNGGADIDKILWFPHEYRIDTPRGSTFEFKLEQKKHSLLGGPFESDWIQ